MESKTAHEHLQKQVEQYASTHKFTVGKLEKTTAVLRAKDDSLAKRDEQYFELEMQLTSAKTELEAVNSAHQYEISRCQKTLQENSSLKQQLRQNLGNETQAAVLVAELDTAKASFDSAKKQIQDLSLQLSLAQKNQTTTENERLIAAERTAALEASASSQAREVDTLIKQLEAKDTELVHAREKQAMVLNGAKKDHAAQHERLVKESSILRESHETLKIEFRNMHVEKDKLFTELESHRVTHDQALIQVAHLEAQLRSEKTKSKTIVASSDARGSDLQQTKEQCIRLEGEAQGLKAANEQLDSLTKGQCDELSSTRTTLAKQEEEIKLLRTNKQELERIILATDSSSKELKSALLQEEARKNTLEHGIEGLIEQKDLRAQLLSDNQSKCADLERELKDQQASMQAAEVKAGEFEALWQNEVASRNKAGAKILEIEKAAATWEGRLQKEKARTAEAVRRKQDVETRLQDTHHRVAQLEGKTATVTERHASIERELLEYKTGNRRSPAIQAHINHEQSNLQSKIHLLESELAAAREQARAANSASSEAAVKLASGSYVSREEMQLYKREIDLKAKQKISAARDELNELLLRSKLQHEAQIVGMRRETSLAKTQAAEHRIQQLEYETHTTYQSSLAADKADLSAMAANARRALAPLNRSTSTAWTDLQAAKAAYKSKQSAAASKREQTASMLSSRSLSKSRLK